MVIGNAVDFNIEILGLAAQERIPNRAAYYQGPIAGGVQLTHDLVQQGRKIEPHGYHNHSLPRFCRWEGGSPNSVDTGPFSPIWCIVEMELGTQLQLAIEILILQEFDFTAFQIDTWFKMQTAVKKARHAKHNRTRKPPISWN